MEKFISEVKLNPEINKKEAFLDIFKLDEEQLEMMLFFGMFNINDDIDSLEEQLTNMRLLDFDNFIKEELELLHKQYPSNKPVQFELFVLDENDDFVKSKLNGVSAFTDWNGKMCFVVLPEENARSTIRSVVTHEYHHHWRISALGLKEDGETLLDRMVLEGLAEHFVKERLGDEYLGPYKDALSETQAITIWESTYRNHINDQGTSTDIYMFGNDDKGLPFWGGYSLGFYLIKWFLDKNKNLAISDLTLLPSDKFIK
ncbi:DUF2268 domain-containing putative Zn-dependent protease [Alkalihalobacillus macyae]|uniref:DUF2268 domain-containing putative Zn-dependent protease n=1 Tax=Guptibacillus hwajinpoensis TaxID=208199 RepID=UPI00273AC0CC|nr:DUF2268 domain-containing putative Zn-dependent protease [Alkalihalobacillus macyae]MDP4552795.1 DUF2268 domain-containing putative Zn-dependent protease [Alkalihalobacillus macyae]